jgi:hypothetical protein
MQFVPWMLMGLNVIGAAVMIKWGLPKEVPFFGREDGDPLLGFLGLTAFVSSIAVRVALTVNA